jgi:hypothetical protein
VDIEAAGAIDRQKARSTFIIIIDRVNSLTSCNEIIMTTTPSVLTTTTASSLEATRITAGAKRMRATRRRRREGLRCILLDLRDDEIDRLIALGHLRQADREDKNEVLLALYRFLDHSALGGGHR